MLIPTYPHHHNSNTTPAARWCAATDATPHSCASSQSGARRAAATGERAQVRHARRWRGRSVGAGALARFVLSRSQPTTTAAPRWHCCQSESATTSRRRDRPQDRKALPGAFDPSARLLHAIRGRPPIIISGGDEFHRRGLVAGSVTPRGRLRKRPVERLVTPSRRSAGG